MSLRIAALLLTVALTAAACAGDSDRGATGSPIGAAAPVEEEQVGGVDEEAPTSESSDAADSGGGSTVEALWWTAATLDGDQFAASDLAGENVVLWMWAPWCTVCNREAPEVADALADLPDDVTIVGVAGRDEVGPMREFVAEHGLGSMTHVVDADGSIWASYGISYQPAWVFIAADGEAAVAAGMLGYDGILAGIDEVFRS